MYDSLLYFQHRKIEQTLKRIAEESANCTVLEIGSGTKAVTHKRLFKKSRFIASDVERYDGVELIVDVTNATNVESGSFDVVICMNVLEHILHPEKAIGEMHRILKTKGRLFLVTPFLFPVHDPPFDFYRYTEFSLTSLLSGKFSRVSIQKVYLLSSLGMLKRFVLYYIAIAEK